jgi:hypothetical protein
MPRCHAAVNPLGGRNRSSCFCRGCTGGRSRGSAVASRAPSHARCFCSKSATKPLLLCPSLRTRSSGGIVTGDLVIPGCPRRAGPESKNTGNFTMFVGGVHGFRARRLRPRPGMTPSWDLLMASKALVIGCEYGYFIVDSWNLAQELARALAGEGDHLPERRSCIYRLAAHWGPA